MANGNFIVQNGLQVGPLTIDATTGSITTTGNVSTTGTVTTFINEIVIGTEAVYGQLTANAGYGSLSTLTGTFVVTGGTGISGDLFVGGNVHTTGTAYLKIPAGTTAQRPGVANVALGMIRYNSTISSFEGYGAGSAWSSLGGVKSVDGFATITAESSAGAGDDVLRFYSGSTGSSVQVAWASASNISILPTTNTTSKTTGALQVSGGVGINNGLWVGGSVNFDSNLAVPNFSSGNITGTASTLAATNFSTANAQITGTGSYLGTGTSLVNSVYGTTGYYTNFSAANISGVINSSTTTAVATNLSSSNLVATGGSINNVTVGATTATAGRFTTVTATTVNAGTIGNSGATLTGTLNTAAQTNITSVGTLTSLAVGAVTSSGTVIASTVQAGTIGNSGATLTGTLSTAAQTNVTSVGTLTGLTVGGATQVNSTLGVTGVTQLTNATDSTGAGTGALQVTGGASFGGNVYVAGNLEIAGTQTTFNTNNVIVDDSILYIADSNSGDVVDIGFVGHFINPGYQHTGFVRDASDGVWKLFAGVAAEPTTTVDFTSATYAALKTGAVTSSGTVIASTVQAGTIGNSGATLTGTLNTAAQTGITSVGTLTSLSVSGALSAGSFTVPTAAQPNITSVGTLTSLSVSGALSAGSFTVPTAAQTNITSLGTLTGLTVSGAIAPNTNNTINLGGVSNYWATIYGTSFVGVSTTAKYADLAENYQADLAYPPGTVVMFGGPAEITMAGADTTSVAGIVSTNPAHLMNGALSGANVIPLALQGRVPCRVIGPVKKGDMMVSAGFGYAKASATPQCGQVIGKALSDFTGEKGQIEVVVGRV